MNSDTHLVSPRDPSAWTAEPFPDQVVRRLDKMDGQIRSLEDWRLEMRTVWRIVQLTFGTSILAVVVGLLNLLRSLPS